MSSDTAVRKKRISKVPKCRSRWRAAIAMAQNDSTVPDIHSTPLMSFVIGMLLFFHTVPRPLRGPEK